MIFKQNPNDFLEGFHKLIKPYQNHITSSLRFIIISRLILYLHLDTIQSYTFLITSIGSVINHEHLQEKAHPQGYVVCALIPEHN